MTVYSSYTPNFKCATDGNGKGLVSASIGLITYDEVVFAGGYYGQQNSNYYLYNKLQFWTMSPAGFASSSAGAQVYRVGGSSAPGYLSSALTDSTVDILRPVISLKSNTKVIGSGTSTDPFVVQ